MSISRRQLLLGAAGSVAAAASRKPNIVWIMADDLGIGDLGCYGQKIIQTPNIDRMAAEGMRFTDAYAGCTVCAPSRSTLMTGLHMGHTPVRSNGGGTPLLPNELTVAELLKHAGYATGCFGKWGLGDIGTIGVPWKKGFDEFYGYLHQVHAHFFYPQYLFHNEKKDILPGNDGGKRTSYSHDFIADKALSFIRRNHQQPFFAYVPFTIPHLELLVPEESRKPYRGKFPDLPYTSERRHYAEQPERRSTYAGMISRMDSDVGRILSLLKELKVDDNTVVFFTSDNGGATRLWDEEFFTSNGPFRGHKQNLYEGGIRAPMLARWPGRIKPGTTSSHQWYFCDFLPTAAELAGAASPKGIDGISAVPALTGKKQKSHEYLYWELPRTEPGNTGQFRKEKPMAAARVGDWKVIRPAPDAAVELYNLKEDIGETRNLAAEKPDVLARYEPILTSARTEPRPQKESPHNY